MANRYIKVWKALLLFYLRLYQIDFSYKMIKVIDSLPWVHCASGNVYFQCSNLSNVQMFLFILQSPVAKNPFLMVYFGKYGLMLLFCLVDRFSLHFVHAGKSWEHLEFRGALTQRFSCTFLSAQRGLLHESKEFERTSSTLFAAKSNFRSGIEARIEVG